MPIKRASPKAKSDHVFGHARKPAKRFRVGLYVRVSTDDQQTLPMQSHALREYAARRGWTIAMQVREVGSGAAQRQAREKLLEAARRREIDVVLVWRLERWGRSVGSARNRRSVRSRNPETASRRRQQVGDRSPVAHRPYIGSPDSGLTYFREK
jgi:predicted site-specific integrase-resolvase